MPVICCAVKWCQSIRIPKLGAFPYENLFGRQIDLPDDLCRLQGMLRLGQVLVCEVKRSEAKGRDGRKVPANESTSNACHTTDRQPGRGHFGCTSRGSMDGSNAEANLASASAGFTPGTGWAVL